MGACGCVIVASKIVVEASLPVRLMNRAEVEAGFVHKPPDYHRVDVTLDRYGYEQS